MKCVFFRSALALGCLPFLFLSSPSHGATPPLILSEVQTKGESVTDEYIEIRNLTDASIDLSGMQLRRRTSSGSESSIKVFGAGTTVPAEGYWLFAHSAGRYALPYADVEGGSSALADNNSIGLFTESGVSGILIDSVAWGTGAPFTPETPLLQNPGAGKSLTRDPVTLGWATDVAPTPTNSRGEVYLETPSVAPDSALSSLSPVRINEVFANPRGDESAEFIELYNPSDGPIDLTSFRLRDDSKTGEYTFPPSSPISALGYFVLERSVSKLSLNNTDETLSLFDAGGLLVDSMTYAKTKEGVSLNFTGKSWRGGTPTPGQLNIVNTLPETKEKVPKKGYRGIAITFDARGKDSDGSTLKYTWDFGDGHKSYKEKTEHRYEKNGTYQVTLTTTDGSDDVLETFALKIASLPKPNIRITALVPNPSGKDSDGEWLMIENRGKKAIDLKGYGIASGWKKLSNHPIRESFIIPPHSERKLTREFSLFTLPNQKGKLELRAPDGKVLQDIKYKLSKSVAEDVVYRKEKGKRWEWDETEAPDTEEGNTDEVVNEEPLPVVSALPTPTDPVASPEPAAPPTTEVELVPQALPEDIPEEALGDPAVLGASTTELEPVSTPITPPPSDPPLLLWFKHLFIHWNSSLNNWQNSKTAP